MKKMKTLSVIIPLRNEAASIPELWERLSSVLDTLTHYAAEVIFIDDGSTDETLRLLSERAQVDKRIKVISFVRNFKKAAALAAGFDYATGDIVITMDGDLQHEPEEIPNFVKKMEEGNDMVISWRHKRRDNPLTRKFPSRIANIIIARISGLKLHDFGGTFHAYRRELLEGIELYSELHRFIPALVNWGGGWRYAELPINNPDRKYGKSNYGLGRIVKVFFDLIIVKYFSSFISQSLQFFGPVGLIFIGAGGLGGLFLSYKKIFLGTAILIEHGPLFIVSIFLLLAGIQFIFFGLMTEVLSRVYYSTSKKKSYRVRKTVNVG